MRGGELDNVCFFGGFARGYPRSEVLRKGLEKLGVGVRICHASPKRRVITRYAVLAWRYWRMRRDFRIIFVPEFRHKDVPLAYMLARLTAKRLVFDPLVSRFDTKVRDRGDAREGSFQAWHNRNLDRISFALSDLVLADTQAHADFYRSEFGAPAEKIRVLPVGFDEKTFATNGSGPRDTGTSETFRVLFFGNYLPLHGVDVIVRAAKLLRGHAGIEFILIGRGQTFPEVEEFVCRERLTNVTLLDRVPMDSLVHYLSEADVSLGVLGATDKTRRVVANKVYQSMAVGKVVISADSSAIRELFADGENICLVPPADPEALATKIEFLRARPDRVRAIGARAAELVHEKYSSLAIGSMFLEYCEPLVDGSVDSKA